MIPRRVDQQRSYYLWSHFKTCCTLFCHALLAAWHPAISVTEVFHAASSVWHLYYAETLLVYGTHWCHRMMALLGQVQPLQWPSECHLLLMPAYLLTQPLHTWGWHNSVTVTMYYFYNWCASSFRHRHQPLATVHFLLLIHGSVSELFLPPCHQWLKLNFSHMNTNIHRESKKQDT